MENEWARELKAGKKVDVIIENIYDKNPKPPVYQPVEYYINRQIKYKIF